MNFTWDVTVFGISDGTQNAVALLQPVQYGATTEDAEYAVEATTRSRRRGAALRQLHFQNEKLTKVVGFTGDTDTGAPREITPTQGDTFTSMKSGWMSMRTARSPGHQASRNYADFWLRAVQVGATLCGPGRLRRRIRGRGPGRESVPGLYADHSALSRKCTRGTR